MKKGILLLLAVISLTVVKAENINKSKNKAGVINHYNEAITFIEKGVEFHIFLNGKFDFNTHYKNTRYSDYTNKRYKINKGIHIERDRTGRLRRVGNSFINYDIRGSVKRIGAVYIDYRFGKITKIGNLKVTYNRWGKPTFYGSVKYNDHCKNDTYYSTGNSNIDHTFNYDNVYFYKSDFKRNYRKYKEDDRFFYYRAIPNARIGKYSKVLKRCKNKKYAKKLPKKRITLKKRKKSRRS